MVVKLCRCSPLLSLGALCVISSVALLHASDPGYYQKSSSWEKTLSGSVESIHATLPPDDIAPFESKVLRGGAAPEKISVDVTGAPEMILMVVGDPDTIWGVANWAEPRLIDPEGEVHPLTTPGQQANGKPALDWEVTRGRYDVNINLHSGLYEPLQMQGREYPLGIHVMANSTIRVPLNKRFLRFEATVGIDDWAEQKGNVRFRVLGPRAAAIEGLWDLLERDFPHAEDRRALRHERLDGIWRTAWTRLDAAILAAAYARACESIPPLAQQARATAAEVKNLSDLTEVRALYARACRIRDAIADARVFDFEALRMAIADLEQTFGAEYPDGPDYLENLAQQERHLKQQLSAIAAPDSQWTAFVAVENTVRELGALKSRALLSNPLLDFERLMVVKRKPVGEPRRSQWADKGLGEYLGLPRQSSWGLGTIPRVDGWDNEIAVLEEVGPSGNLHTLYRPEEGRLVSDVDLHWDADRILISMPDARRHWQLFEVNAGGQDLRQLTPEDVFEVHNYDGCYLPNGDITFVSTAPLQGVPCNSTVIVGMMYLMDGDGRNIRQVCFEQDHDYTPSVLNNGRVLYLRWDYTDTPHVWNRVLMSMNPDGTGQMEYYGSNSYWPNAVFFARAVPGHPTKIAGIVTGHHEGRVGDLVVFDPALGRHEASGVVQQIPFRGQRVQPVIEDKLTEHSWPKFLHPWPLNEKYFLVSAKPTPDSLWGIYLVDVFDNMELVHEVEEYALLEPIPLRPRPRPRVIPDKVKPDEEEATVYLANLYQGPGLRGVPQGSVKKLRIFTYHFGFQKMAGIDHRVGTDGPWEVKRVLGTVPVQEDGSALFRIPARTPISVQPLDAEGKALALMRSWMTAMPGEVLSCVGCHEHQSTAPPPQTSLALAQQPSDIEPWYGPMRGFSFAREVQPVLDRHCVGCHNGQSTDGEVIPVDLRADQGHWVVYRHGNPELGVEHGKTEAELLGRYAGVFPPSYVALRQFVRVGGLESDLHPLPAKEFHADTSELIQLLQKGHHGVALDNEDWDRLITWIDLNAPCHGSWAEVSRIPIAEQPERRQTLRQLFGGVNENAELDPALNPRRPVDPITPTPAARPVIAQPACDDWPWDTQTAQARQRLAGRYTQQIDLGDGVTLDLVGIPAGRFVMGDANGAADEWPLRVVDIPRSFWMARCEITNEQFARFNPGHDSRFEHRSSWIFDESYLGWPLNEPRQPVVRVSYEEAHAFCQWLSARTGLTVSLPTEEQWEYACRAGTATPMSYGGLDIDFSRLANMGDNSLERLATEGWRPKAPDCIVRDDRFDDGALVTAAVGQYAPNAWGLFDMHGNAAEWTRSDYGRYGNPAAGGGDVPSRGLAGKVVRGGSWRDRPERCRSSFRLAYAPYQKVFNVGFRIVVEDAAPSQLAELTSAMSQPR